MKTLAVVGISGAGKTTFLKRVQAQALFRHVTASELIKSEIERDEERAPSADELRKGAIDENQSALIDAFLRQKGRASEPLVLDGHVIIDTPTGLVEIEADVFRSLGIDHVIFLQANPESILRQREADSGRSRPPRTCEQLDDLQNRSLLVAARVARDLGIPLTVLNAAHGPQFIELLSQ